MDTHTQRGLDEQRKLCRLENARVAVERGRAEPIVTARHTVEAFDVIERLGRRTRTWRPLGQFYGCMGAAFAVKPTGESGPLLVLKVVLNDETHGGAARTRDEVVSKFQAEIKFTGDTERLPSHENLPFCYGYFVAAARGLPDLDWMEEYTECDTLCIVMEHIQGITLQSLAGQHHAIVDAGATSLFPEALLLSYCEQLLHAIDHLKHHDIVHRDVKPDNVMVSGPFRQALKVSAPCVLSRLEPCSFHVTRLARHYCKCIVILSMWPLVDKICYTRIIWAVISVACGCSNVSNDEYLHNNAFRVSC